MALEFVHSIAGLGFGGGASGAAKRLHQVIRDRMPCLAQDLHLRLIEVLKLPYGIGQPRLEDFGIIPLIGEFLRSR